MDDKKEILSEERYQRTKKKIVLVALVILLLGLSVGSLLIFKGLNNSKKVNETYTEGNKQAKINNLTKQIATEKVNLEAKKTELQAKGLTPSSKYDSGEAYDLYIITNALNPSFSYCHFNEYMSNSLTSNYCSLTNDLEEVKRMDVSFEKDWNNFDSIPFYMFGTFIIIASLMISSSIYMFAKRREIMAFGAQQVMPVAQEGIEKMAPTVGTAVGTIAKGVTKGIKEGLKDEDDEE